MSNIKRKKSINYQIKKIDDNQNKSGFLSATIDVKKQCYIWIPGRLWIQKQDKSFFPYRDQQCWQNTYIQLFWKPGVCERLANFQGECSHCVGM